MEAKQNHRLLQINELISIKLYLSFSCNQYFKAKSLGYPSFLNRKNFMLGNKKKRNSRFFADNFEKLFQAESFPLIPGQNVKRMVSST